MNHMRVTLNFRNPRNLGGTRMGSGQSISEQFGRSRGCNFRNPWNPRNPRQRLLQRSVLWRKPHPATVQLALSARERDAGQPCPATQLDGCELRGGRYRAGIGEGHSPGWETPC